MAIMDSVSPGAAAERAHVFAGALTPKDLFFVEITRATRLSWCLP